MKFKNTRLLILLGFLTAVSFSNPVIRASIFGEVQHFWKESKKKGGENRKKITVLPVYIMDYWESIPCDSCHWLSPNGLEFVLENYLLRLAESESAHYNSELIHPENEFVKLGNFNLEAIVNQSQLPWDKIFYGFTEKLIIRNNDSFTSTKVKKGLNRLGGKLGGSHILMIQDFKIKVYPRASNRHVGKLAFQFYLLFWNVQLAYPEWVIFFKTKTGTTDLDITLDKYLLTNLTPYIQSLPEMITVHKQKEPR